MVEFNEGTYTAQPGSAFCDAVAAAQADMVKVGRRYAALKFKDITVTFYSDSNKHDIAEKYVLLRKLVKLM
jgi:hypothetical protein